MSDDFVFDMGDAGDTIPQNGALVVDWVKRNPKAAAAEILRLSRELNRAHFDMVGLQRAADELGWMKSPGQGCY